MRVVRAYGAPARPRTSVFLHSLDPKPTSPRRRIVCYYVVLKRSVFGEL